MKEKSPAKQRVGRPTKAEAMKRVRECAAMLLTNRPRSEILQHFCDTYGLQETSVTNVITNAYKYISETHAVDKEGIVHKHIENYYDVYRLAYSLGDSRGCVQALNSIEKLLKLTSPDALVQNNTLNLNLKDLTFDELKALLGKEE